MWYVFLEIPVLDRIVRKNVLDVRCFRSSELFQMKFIPQMVVANIPDVTFVDDAIY